MGKASNLPGRREWILCYPRNSPWGRQHARCWCTVRRGQALNHWTVVRGSVRARRGEAGRGLPRPGQERLTSAVLLEQRAAFQASHVLRPPCLCPAEPTLPCQSNEALDMRGTVLDPPGQPSCPPNTKRIPSGVTWNRRFNRASPSQSPDLGKS